IEACCRRHEAPRCPHSHDKAAVGREVAAAGVEPGDRSGVTHDMPFRVESQNAVGAAIDEQQSLILIKGKAARVTDPRVLTKNAAWRTVGPEGKECAVAI